MLPRAVPLSLPLPVFALTLPFVFSGILKVCRPALSLLPGAPSESALPTACLLRFGGRRCRHVPVPALAAALPLSRYGFSFHARTLASNQIPREIPSRLQPDGSPHRHKVDLSFAGAKDFLRSTPSAREMLTTTNETGEFRMSYSGRFSYQYIFGLTAHKPCRYSLMARRSLSSRFLPT